MTGGFRPGAGTTTAGRDRRDGMIVDRLLRTATQWRTALTPTTRFALTGTAGAAATNNDGAP